MARRRYDLPHRRARLAFTALVDGGTCRCPKCGRLIDPSEPWDLGHSDDGQSYTGPEHRVCNRRAAGIKGNRLRARRVSVVL